MSVRDFHFLEKLQGRKRRAHHDEKTEDTDYEKKVRLDELDVSGLDALSEEQTFWGNSQNQILEQICP